MLQAIANGLTTDQIAFELGTSADSVRHAVRAIHSKLGTSTRAHAVAVGLTVSAIDEPVPDLA